ncbi:MAG: hypothetical protein U0X75_26045 [Acidobacteriota bacterium]
MKHKVTLLADDDYDLTDDVAPEYDFSALEVVRRGPRAESKTVTLAPDVAAVFDSSEAVNEALRTLIRMMKSAA